MEIDPKLLRPRPLPRDGGGELIPPRAAPSYGPHPPRFEPPPPLSSFLDLSHWTTDVEPETRCEVCDRPFAVADLPNGEICCDECYWRDK